MKSHLTLYEALLSANVPSEKARAAVEALEQEMYTVLATKNDMGAQAQLFSERLGRFQAELRLDLVTKEEFFAALQELRGVIAAIQELRADVAALRESDAAIRADIVGLQESVGGLRADVTALRASGAVIRADIVGLQESVGGLRADVTALRESHAAIRADIAALRESDAAIRADIAALRVDMARMANTLTLRLGTGLVAGLGLLFAALQLA